MKRCALIPGLIIILLAFCYQHRSFAGSGIPEESYWSAQSSDIVKTRQLLHKLLESQFSTILFFLNLPPEISDPGNFKKVMALVAFLKSEDQLPPANRALQRVGAPAVTSLAALKSILLKLLPAQLSHFSFLVNFPANCGDQLGENSPMTQRDHADLVLKYVIDEGRLADLENYLARVSGRW